MCYLDIHEFCKEVSERLMIGVAYKLVILSDCLDGSVTISAVSSGESVEDNTNVRTLQFHAKCADFDLCYVKSIEKYNPKKDDSTWYSISCYNPEKCKDFSVNLIQV